MTCTNRTARPFTESDLDAMDLRHLLKEPGDRSDLDRRFRECVRTLVSEGLGVLDAVDVAFDRVTVPSLFLS